MLITLTKDPRKRVPSHAIGIFDVLLNVLKFIFELFRPFLGGIVEVHEFIFEVFIGIYLEVERFFCELCDSL